MSWQKHWRKREDGKYEYLDNITQIPYIIDEKLYKRLEAIETDAEREDLIITIIMRAADAIGRNLFYGI